MNIETIDVNSSCDAIDDVRNLQLTIAGRIAREKAAAAEALERQRDIAINYWNKSNLWCARYHRAITCKMDNMPIPEDIRLTKSCDYYFERMKRNAEHTPRVVTKAIRGYAESVHMAQTIRRGKITRASVSDSYLYFTDENYT